MKTYLTVYFGTVLVAMFLVPIISRLAKWYRLVDAPGPRKVHQNPIPRIGGVAFVVSTLVLVLPVFFLDNKIGQSFRESRTEFIVLLTGAFFIFVVGLIDDLRSLRGPIKLLCIIAASLAICASGATLHSVSMGTLFEIQTGWAAWPLTVFWIVMITVCMNIIDGLDGLAAGVAAMVSGTIVLLAIWSGQAAMAVLMLALLGSVTGFLFFNFYPAKIFMGDCGSLFLGFMIGAGSIICQMKTSTLVGLALPFLVLGAPIFDTSLVIVSRCIIQRRSMFAPDRNHLHHRLLDLGLHHRAVVIVIYAITAICASIGVFMLTTDGKWSVTLLVGGLLLLFSMFACMHRGCGRKMLKGLKRNWAIARQVRAERHSFQRAIVRIRESTSLREWWETVCAMGNQMNFQSIGLWKCQNGDYVSTCLWNRPQDQFATGKTVKINFQVGGNGADEYQIRACIEADDDLEPCGRQTTLLARLMDEFPPPEPEVQTPDQPPSAMLRSTIREGAERSSSLAMTDTQTFETPAHMPAPLNVMGIPVVPFESYDQALECAGQMIELGGKSMWIAINPIKIYHAWRNPELLKIMRQADVGICDGVGVSIASKILNGQSIARCTGCDLFFRLVSEAERKGWGIYLLGASAQSNATARTELQRRYPDLKIVGWHDGYFEDSRPVIKQINSSGADLLFVAMGSPKQEQWMWRHRQAININICMGIGGSLDIASGSMRRAPRIFRMIGAEFLFRFIMEPRKRLRIQKVLFPYFARVLGKKAVDLTLSDEGREE